MIFLRCLEKVCWLIVTIVMITQIILVPLSFIIYVLTFRRIDVTELLVDNCLYSKRFFDNVCQRYYCYLRAKHLRRLHAFGL